MDVAKHRDGAAVMNSAGTASRVVAPPLVVFGDDWGRHVSSMQHLVRYLLPEYRIVWVNGIGHRPPGLKDVGRAVEKLCGAIRQRTRRPPERTPTGPAPDRIVHPAVLPWHGLRLVEAINRWSLTRAILRALRELDASKPIVVTGSPPSVSVLGRLGELATIYFCMDDFAHLPGVSARMLLPLERRLLDQVDAVVATARELTRLKVPRNGVVHYLPQGVNYDHFATPRDLPADLARLPRPVIGFAGGVGPALNLEMLDTAAEAFPQGSIVLVGPEQPGLGVIRAPNVHRLGPRPYEILPAYVQHFDVGVIPYVRNPWTEAVDPLKLLEYLAAGIPVVTTDLPEVRKYGAAIEIVRETRDFVPALRRALADRGENAVRNRRGIARENTWQARAGRFLTIVRGLTHARVDV